MAIYSASSCQPNAASAVAEIGQQLGPHQSQLLLFFCSTHYQQQELGEALQQQFPNSCIVGCTSAGELSPNGYAHNSITAVSFASHGNFVASALIQNIAEFSLTDSQELVDNLLDQCQQHGVADVNNNTLAITLLDGLSIREEAFLQVLNAFLGHIPLLGGSAGDDLHFEHTEVFYQGQFYRNAAVLLVINTRHPFSSFSHHHLQPKQEKMVVTHADSARRRVYELNGLPAAQEYARLCDLPVNKLTNLQYALHPLTIKIGDSYYARSVQQAHTDGSLSFYSAIELGVVLTDAAPKDLVQQTALWLDQLQQNIGPPQLVLTFDCILRSIEIEHCNLHLPMNELLQDYKMAGFSTYGEQMGGSHLNHTFTGVYFGCINGPQ